jgi:hypothetical protein
MAVILSRRVRPLLPPLLAHSVFGPLKPRLWRAQTRLLRDRGAFDQGCRSPILGDVAANQIGADLNSGSVDLRIRTRPSHEPR